METQEVQYGVRYGDGEVEHVGERLGDADRFIDSIRGRIAAGDYAADEYEPMSIVKRTRITTVVDTDWGPA